MENPYGSVKVSDMASGVTNGLGNLLGGVQSMETGSVALGAGVGGLVGSWLGNGFMGGNGTWGGRGGYGVGSPVGVADLAVDSNMLGRMAGVEAGIANISSNQSSDRVLSELESIENQISTDSAQIGSLISMNARDAASGIGAINTNIANGNFTTLSSINALGRDFTTIQTQGIIQALNTANLTNSVIQSGFNEIGRDTTNATNQIIMGQNAISPNMAECCCAIKSTINADGDATRALINDIRLADLQTQLVDAKNQISNSNQTNALVAAMASQTNVILSHIRPFVSSAI